MMGDNRILVVVPARGGSKGIPLKNLRKVAGVSLVTWVGRVVQALPWVDRAVVSTDHDLIAREAELAGLAAPFRRPQTLSGDLIGDVDVLTHALTQMESEDGCRYDIVVMLQPTCPFRRPDHVTATVERLVREGLDAVWTVTRTDLKYHPLKQLVVDCEGRMSYHDPEGAGITARQQLSPVFHRNGAAYTLRRKCLLEKHSLLGERAGAVIIEDPLVNVDTLDDLATAERLWAEVYSHTPADLCRGTSSAP